MAWSRKSRHERGYGTAWDKQRKYILSRDKHLCQECWRNGRLSPGNHVDHITPKAKGGTDEPDNLQTMCLTCHERKTIEERGHKPRITFGADGWPV